MAGAQVDFLLTPFVDANGEVAVDYTVEFYIAGTSTPVHIYAEKELSTDLGTSVTLDSKGTYLCFVDTNNYLKLIIKDTDAVTFKTYDGIGFTVGGPLSSDAYLRDGSLALTGAMDGDGNNLTDLGNVTLGASKSLDVNDGHGYSPVPTDMIVYGDSTGYIRRFVATGIDKLFHGTTELWNLTASSLKFLKPLDMNSNLINNVANGVSDADGINLSQLDDSIYALGLIPVYTAVVATGDGTGKDASNKISHLNLGKDGGLLSHGGNYEVFFTSGENTVSISQDFHVNTGGRVILRSYAAITFSDQCQIRNTRVTWSQETGTLSYDVTFSAGVVFWNAEGDFNANVIANGQYSTLGASIYVVRSRVSVGGDITSAQDFRVDINASAFTSGNITCTAGGIKAGSFAKVDTTDVLTGGETTLSVNGVITCRAFSGAGYDLNLSTDSYIGCSTTLTSAELHVHKSKVACTGTITCTKLDSIEHGQVTGSGHIQINGALDVESTSYVNSVTRTTTGGETVSAAQMCWVSP